MAKKKDLPAMPFYFGDWRKAPEIRALELDDRMIWFEMLGFMWESTERGYLTLNGAPINNQMLARMIGITEERLTLSITILETLSVFSRRESDGAIYNRKMVRDEEIRLSRAKGGVLGGNPILKAKKTDKEVNHKGYPLVEPSSENEYENESTDKIEDDDFNAGHDEYAKKLLSPRGESEKLPIEQFTEKKITPELLRKFNLHLTTEHKNHVHYSEYTRHLKNWLNTQPKEVKKPFNPANKMLS